LEAEQPGRQSEGSFNRGFLTKTYPAIYLPNIIPALSARSVDEISSTVCI